jgi:hypothetical protein
VLSRFSFWDGCPKLIKENQMTQVNTIFTAYGKFLTAGSDMRSALESALVRGKLPMDTVNKLSAIHARHYGCVAVQSESGAWRFFNDAEDTTSANRNESATRQWNRTIAPFSPLAKSKQGGARNKTEPVSERAKLLSAYEKLSVADRKWFRSQAGW